MAGVALLALGWVWWRAWSLLVPVSRPFCRGTLRGRRAPWRHPSFHVRTWRHAPSVDVAGVVLLALGWVWWRAWSLLVARGTLRGRRGAWRHPPSFHVAGVHLGDIHFRFAGQAWHFQASALSLRGRRGTYMALGWLWWRAWAHAAALCGAGAGVALGDIHLRFAWQAWHLG